MRVQDTTSRKGIVYNHKKVGTLTPMEVRRERKSLLITTGGKVVVKNRKAYAELSTRYGLK